MISSCLKTERPYETPVHFLRQLEAGHKFSSRLTIRPTTKFKIDLSYSRARLANDNLDYGEDTDFATTARQCFLKLQYLLRNEKTFTAGI